MASDTSAVKTDQKTTQWSGLERLYAAHAPEAFKLAYLVTGDSHLAADIVQDAFIRVAGRFEHLRNPSSFGPYFRRAVLNGARGHWRRRSVERKHLRGEAEVSAKVVDPPDIGTAEELKAALQTLPYRQRAAIVLHYYADLSERQVADALECSPAAVKSLIHRGVVALREGMGDLLT